MNILSENSEDQIAKLLKSLSQTVRLQIVLIIGEHESCVCHLEAILGIRQARISQHLIALRNTGIVSTRRDGRHIYYQLENPKILDLIYQTAEIYQVDTDPLKALSNRIEPGCVCPRCAKEMAEC